jgi:pimeloyl-ACP methyl ester carboxylesterase
MSGAITTPEVMSGYAQVGALKMYYETQGNGRPLLLLHGGLTTIDISFAKMRPALAKRWTTIAIEQQAHGHTADIERPLAYEQMVEDTAAVLKHLNVAEADLFGWSDGGIVALGLAARHPNLVRKVAIIGAGYNAEAETPEFKKRMAALRADDARMAPFREAHAKIAPTPGSWPVLIDKVKAMYFAFAGWSEDEMRALKAPLLVMLGDADFTRPEHALELFRMVPNGRLAVLPGSDHSAPITRSEWVTAMLIDFFDAPMSKAEEKKP